jgi:hypothetical protein
MSVYLPLLLSAAFGLLAAPLSRRMPPQVAGWLLSVGGLAAALASSASLALLAFDALAQNPLLASRARWSDEVLQHHDPLAVPIGVLAWVAVLAFSWRFLRTLIRRARAIGQAYALAAALEGSGGELCVLPDTRRQAYAVPGRPGRIAVTTALLRSLDGPQRRALLAHERSHLQHHHHLHHGLVELAVAINPLLRRLEPAIDLAIERWADEDAARVSRRDTVAAALTHAAAAGDTMWSPPVAVLAAGRTAVRDRIQAMRAPAPRLAAWQLALPATLLLAAALAVALAMHETEHLYELAQLAYRSGQR